MEVGEDVLVGARLVRIYGPDRWIGIGVGLAAGAGLAAMGLGWAGIGSTGAARWPTPWLIASIAVPIAIYLIAFAIIIPQSVAGAMAPFGDKAGAASEFTDPIVTEITAASTFWKANAEHQEYYRNNKAQGYCRAVIAPKLDKLGLDK